MLTLTATELHRFIQCNGSRLLEKVPLSNHDTTLVDEGNAAHWLVEQVFKGNFDTDELIARKANNDVFITSDMVEHCEEYLSDIMGQGDVEIVTDYCKQGVYEVRGRADHIYSEPEVLHINDFKYGWKIVEPEMNWTLISHAIGFIQSYATKPEEIVFTIYQPRPYHPKGSKRSWRITYSDLMGYWQQIDQVLSNPQDMLNTGDHCYKCLSQTKCPSYQIALMNSIDVSEMAYNSNVNNRHLSYIIDQIKRAKEVLSQAETAYSDLAMTRLKKGELIPEYSLETSLGNSEWKEGVTCESLEMITGKDLSKKKLVTPNQAKKAGVSPEIIDALCQRKSKGFKLVRVDGAKKAEKLFGQK